jgi:hypothetical protein
MKFKIIRDITKGEIVALSIATNNFSNTSCSTLMGWVPHFDKKGRAINADPNYQSGECELNGKKYEYVKSEWLVKIIEPRGGTIYPRWNASSILLAEVDITPNYIRGENIFSRIWKKISKTWKKIFKIKRKLKLKYTDEMYQDLKAVHGMNAQEELLKIIQCEIDKEVLEKCIKNSDGENREVFQSMYDKLINGGSNEKV